MEEMAAFPMEKGLDSPHPLSLHGHLPLAQRTWKVFSQSWSLLVSVILQAGKQEGTYLFCNRQSRYSHPLIRLLQLSQTHPCLQIQTWSLDVFSNQPVFFDWSHFPSPIFPGWSVQPINSKDTFECCKASCSSCFHLADISSISHMCRAPDRYHEKLDVR